MRAMSPREALGWALGAGTLAIGLKFATYWDHWVYFASSINLVDTVFLSIVGLYLVTASTRSWIRRDDKAVSPLTGVIVMVAITLALAVLLYFIIRRMEG